MLSLLWWGFFLAMVVSVVVIFGVAIADSNNQPCSTYTDWSLKDVPVRCVKELTR